MKFNDTHVVERNQHQFTDNVHPDHILFEGASITGSTIGGPIYLARYARLNDVVCGKYNGFNEYAEAHHATMGSFCCIGKRTVINPFNHPTSWLSAHGFQFAERGFDSIPEYAAFKKVPFDTVEQKPVTIGNDVWMGHNVNVIGGVTVGDGAVIGAGSVVTKDVRPYAIVAGAPAVVRRYRFPRHIIERLLRVKWWDMELCDLAGLQFDNIERCLDGLEYMKIKSMSCVNGRDQDDRPTGQSVRHL